MLTSVMEKQRLCINLTFATDYAVPCVAFLSPFLVRRRKWQWLRRNAAFAVGSEESRLRLEGSTCLPACLPACLRDGQPVDSAQHTRGRRRRNTHQRRELLQSYAGEIATTSRIQLFVATLELVRSIKTCVSPTGS
jgi:hypothetical protein